MIRKRSFDGNGSNDTKGGAQEASNLSNRAHEMGSIFRSRPWPAEATVLAGFAFWVALEVQQPHLFRLGDVAKNASGAHNYPLWPAAAMLTAASSLISCYFEWSHCWTAAAPFNTRAHFHCRRTTTNGADPDGLAVGSTLVPLLFCSAISFVERCGIAANSRSGEVVLIPGLLEAFAFASSVTSLAFAMSATKSTGGRRITTKHVLATSCILFVVVEMLVVANTYETIRFGVCVSTVILPCIGVQAVLLYLHSRQRQHSLFAAFTPGEWCCVAQLLSSLVLAFFFVNVDSSRPKLSSADMHLAIAHSGIFGCILGCILSKFFPSVATKGDAKKLVIWACTAKLVTTAFVTVACVEIAARQWDAAEATTAQGGRLIPISLQWLLSFLSKPDESTLVVFSNISRWMFLIYWAVILLLAAFPAQRMATHLRKIPESTKRSKLVVVSRKYFHFVAVLLFLPATIIAPSMMALSYAVALCVLLLVETMRTAVLSNDKRLADSSINAFYEAFLDEKDVVDNSICKPGQGRQTGVFVVTHMAMIFGCAFPLWVNEVLKKVIGSGRVSRGIFGLLPSMGIVVLGVGDAIGAIVGVYCGIHTWPGTKRTVEGTLGMFVSMVLSSVVISYLDPASGTSTMHDAALAGLYMSPHLMILSILEAFTSQIDNLCLPIAASILCLLQQAGH